VSRDPNPTAPVPFQDSPKTAPLALAAADERPDYTIKEAARILRLADENGKPTDACYALFKNHGYQISGRGDWRITPAALDRIRGVAA
jgi:hypothetical protein